MSTRWTYRDTLTRVDRLGLVFGVIALAATAAGAVVRPGVVLPSYLAAYLFFLGVGVGSRGILLLHLLVGGAWGFVIRRPLEAATATLPLLALLFLPIALGARTLYPWTDRAYVEAHEAVLRKAGYLNMSFWLGRAALYHVVWSGLALLVRWNSVRQDATEDPAPTRRNRTIAAPGLVLVFVTVTFAMIDWGMSTEPEWYSSIYGVMLLVGFALSALALGLIAARILPSSPKAISSLRTVRVPSRPPTTRQSSQGTPRSHATGARANPKIRCRESGPTPR